MKMYYLGRNKILYHSSYLLFENTLKSHILPLLNWWSNSVKYGFQCSKVFRIHDSVFEQWIHHFLVDSEIEIWLSNKDSVFEVFESVRFDWISSFRTTISIIPRLIKQEQTLFLLLLIVCELLDLVLKCIITLELRTLEQ